MENNRVVIDTNVFISSLIGQFSYPYKIFDELILTGEVAVCLSPQLLTEYEEVSKREKFRKIPGFSDRASKLVQALKPLAYFMEPTEVINLLSDEPDNRILELAIEAHARAIVTGNTRDFTFSTFQGIAIQTPKEFYDSFLRE